MAVGDRDHCAVGALGWHPERVALPLHDKDWHSHGFELWEATLGGIIAAARRMERKRQAQHGIRPGIARRPARDAGAGRAPSDHQGQAPQRAFSQLCEDCKPC